MNISIIGGTGFIGINLALHLSLDIVNNIRIIDINEDYFAPLKKYNRENITFVQGEFSLDSDFDKLIAGSDVVYHLASTNIPGNSNNSISAELQSNVIVTARMLDACVKNNVKKVVFVSSGGAVYGNTAVCPISEDTEPNPISSYGLQKLMIEKMLYLYWHQYKLDYRIVRLSNPYGPYQRPNGRLGVVTTFMYRALSDGEINVYGDGTVVRDYIYIDDAVKGIVKIAEYDGEHKLFNLGSGKGTSINQVIDMISRASGRELKVNYSEVRSVDVKSNYLDISRYNNICEDHSFYSLEEGIEKMKLFIMSQENNK